MVNSPSVLVIDDDRSLLFGIQKLFSKAGYAVLTSENGQMGLEAITAHKPDLVICDISMPVMDGLELLKAVKKQSQLNSIPFIFLTANPTVENEVTSFKIGAHDFVAKPFSPDRLLARAESILSRDAAPVQHVEQPPQALNPVGAPGMKSRETPSEKIDYLTYLLKALQDLTLNINTNTPSEALLLKAIRIFNSFYQSSAIEIWIMSEKTRKFEFRTGFFTAPNGFDLITLPRPIEKPADWVVNELKNLWNPGGNENVGAKIKIRIFNSKLNDQLIEPIVMQAFLTQISVILYKNDLANQIEKLDLSFENTIEDTLMGLSKAQELRDHETYNHSTRTAELAVRFAARLGVSLEEQRQIYRGAIFHDIGKIGIPDNILHKTEPLTAADLEIIRKHPLYGYDLLSQFDFLKNALNVPLYHHERWDGSGYPYGLMGKDIPLSARIFSLVDVWDAMTHQRVYRKEMDEETVVRYLQSQAGKSFQPELVTVFVQMVKEDQEN